MSDERDTGGKFTKGYTGGPGRPARAVEAARLEVLNAVVSEDDWRRICERAKKDAIHADEGRDREKGRRFIADYLIGRPRQTIKIESDPDAWANEYSDVSDDELRAAATGPGAAGPGAGPGARGPRGETKAPAKKRAARARTPAPH